MDGVSHCHKNGFCHRDLKPENILITQDYVAKIADFGFAGEIEPNMDLLIGTNRYLPPEIHMIKGKS